MKNKGFSLIEMLAVVIILGVLSVIIVPSIFTMIKNSKEKEYKNIIENIENSAIFYATTNRETIEEEFENNVYYEITLNDLVASGLIKTPLIDPRTDEEIDLNKKVTLGKESDDSIIACYEDEGCSDLKLDKVKPVITLLGSNEVYVFQSKSYTDAGATATDNIDGNITANINATSTVNTSATGNYTVTYNVTDSSGNIANQVTRTVSVINTFEVLVVGGGGGGGYNAGAGGGAGGVVYSSAYSSSIGSYPVQIGNGGNGAGSSNTTGLSGASSVFGTITAYGGGGGVTSAGNGAAGASGGGGAYTGTGGASSYSGQGNAGGNGNGQDGVNRAGAGGGGAGAVGQNTVSATVPGAGGVGVSYSISGISQYYGGGGGGASHIGSYGAGGAGGGGAGGVAAYPNACPAGQTGNNGTANTGGGGGAGGGGGCNGGNGGSGIVIIRYPGEPKATGGTITSVGGYTIHTFTSSGTFNVL